MREGGEREWERERGRGREEGRDGGEMEGERGRWEEIAQRHIGMKSEQNMYSNK